MDKSAELIEIYLDGLQALTDGRGWGIKHQEASDEIHRLIDTHEELLDTLIIALPYVENAVDDIGYKPHVVNRVVNQIKKAIKEAEK